MAGTDPRHAAKLHPSIDPERWRPGYWRALRAQTVKRAEGELARRRACAEHSVSGVLGGWSRRLVPLALAAALGALLLARAGERRESDPALALEDVLGSELIADETLEEGRAASFMVMVEGAAAP